MTQVESIPFPLIVDATWLLSRLESDPTLRVLDGSYGAPSPNLSPTSSESGADIRGKSPDQIPGAIVFDIDQVADFDHPLPHTLPSAEHMQACVRAMGIGADTPIVVFDRRGMFSAARVWWMFRVFGHSQIAVLDGGFPAYRRALEQQNKRQIVLPQPCAPAKPFVAHLDASRVVELDAMQEAVKTNASCILDARGAGRFSGKQEEPRPGMRAGHMPGAINLPYTELLDDNGCFLALDALKQKLNQGLAQAPQTSVICSCGSGVTACILALAYEHCFGRPAAVYDGSWTEWGGRSDTPVVRD